ncbi:MAG TPA: GNAT family N-acetyltransferase [Acidimicrobiia bacterium]|nr:GNAT family N-acetyltransferase [Acidimicrobiia bacterium]
MASEFVLRPVTRDELTEFTMTPLTAFGERFDPGRFELDWTSVELDRTLAAFEGDQIVGTGRLYSLELTMPGGRLLPAAGVSWIAVLPTHRRRGILSAIKRTQLDDAADRGEPLAILYASESGIYRRFGYGVATSSMSVSIERRHSAFLDPVPAGRVRLVDEDDARKLFPEIFDRVRRVQPGAVQRVDAWWPDEFFWRDADEKGTRHYCVYETPDGNLDGYAAYRFEAGWNTDSNATVHVHDLVTASPAARAVLWRYLLDVDLVETIKAWVVPVDEPLRWLLRESRRMRVSRLGDSLWVRVLDAPAALSARTYAVPGRVVFDVVDEVRPDGAASGRVVLDGGPEGADARRTGDDPDLVLDVASLGGILLGGVPASTLARAGLVEERTAGALAVADAMFAVEPQPFSMTDF